MGKQNLWHRRETGKHLMGRVSITGIMSRRDECKGKYKFEGVLWIETRQSIK